MPLKKFPRRRCTAVPVESWDEYTQLYSGFEGPGRLPYAVASFFEQGGRRAYIVRVVHEYGNPIDNADAVAQGQLPGADVSTGTLYLQARNEGSWGNSLRASLGFSVTPISLMPGTDTTELILDVADALPVGSLLLLSLPPTSGQPARRVMRFVSLVRRQGLNDSQTMNLHVTFDVPVDAPPDFAELIEGEIRIIDDRGLIEHFKALGLSARHPRWMARVIYLNSRLVSPNHSWVEADITPKRPDALPLSPSFDDVENTAMFSGGRGRYGDIIFDDFFDNRWTPSDPEPGEGVYTLTHLADLASVVVPDLYVPEPLPEQTVIEAPPSFASGRFEPCVSYSPPEEETLTATPQLAKLHLDPDLGSDLEDITRLQEKLAAFAERLQKFVVLLDVPPGLSQKKILRWRAHFRSSYTAAYYPWLNLSTIEDQRNALILINPSSVAAGIIARRHGQD